ncbi:MAG: hypothetical protein U0531_07960 [Dehalococcoidia bacterium]
MSGTRRRWERFRSVAPAALAALLLVACSTAPVARAQATQDATPAATLLRADDAVQRAVEDRGAEYAGDCAATRSPQDVGKVCSKLVEEREAPSDLPDRPHLLRVQHLGVRRADPVRLAFAGDAPLASSPPASRSLAALTPRDKRSRWGRQRTGPFRCACRRQADGSAGRFAGQPVIDIPDEALNEVRGASATMASAGTPLRVSCARAPAKQVISVATKSRAAGPRRCPSAPPIDAAKRRKRFDSRSPAEV